jgi:LPXTG-site transpeptidase (sortase) family protein
MKSGRGWTPVSLGVIGAGLACLTAAAILFGFQLSGRFDTFVYRSPDIGAAFNAAAILATPSDAAAPAPAPATSPDSAAIARLVIPKIRVDASVVVKGIGADGYMETPDNGYDVAWYDFSGRPGAAGNAVFAGHVDYYKIGPAVFWDLGKLQADDEIDVRLADGSTYRYAIVGKAVFEANAVPVEQVVGRTPDEAITLITCTGTFDRASREYDQRLVVRARRIPESAAGTSPGVAAAAGG